ncbi:MAG: hypothetical protein ACREUU_13785 [Gammaproteobacteria bacterium]
MAISIGAVIAYWWHYTLAPVRRTLDGEWVASHSQQDYWHEVQKGIRRGTWNHDDGFTVGFYGDESWARWIMARVKPGDRMGCLGTRLHHSATSMRYITNQDAGEDADGWLTWWKLNQSTDQRQWIADGFAQRGIALEFPPTAQQTEALLKLLGSSAEAAPEHVKYNAFRWLRESGFEPVDYMLSDKHSAVRHETGLREYAHYEERFPRATKLGILPLGRPGEEGDYSTPAMLAPHFQTAVHAAIWIPFVIGLCLMAWSLRRKTNGESAPNG